MSGVNPNSKAPKRLKSPKKVSKPVVVFLPWASWKPVEMYHWLLGLIVRLRPSPWPGKARTGNELNALLMKYLLSLCQ